MQIVSLIRTECFLALFYVFTYRPGKSRFRERWLKDIIESKVLLMESINF